MKHYIQRSAYLFIFCFLPLTIWAQSRTVTGSVKGSSGDQLPGVSILVKGTGNGTVSDIEGNFNLKVAEGNNTLIFSFIGFKTTEVDIENKSSLEVTMEIDVESLSEVLVIGYGQQKKSLSTGAISSVKAEELKNVSNGRIDQALQGRTAGVNVTPASGSPGSAAKIRIRGVSSNGAADPLYIIDGVRSNASGMSFLSPNEIESMEILKDAASAAIYGAEGANGVIIITTKKGKLNSGVISYSGQYGVQSVQKDLMPMMNAEQYVTYLNEANAAGAPTTADLAGFGEGTDWINELFQTAPMQNHSLSFSGGSEKSTYFIAGTLYEQDGIAGGKKATFDRYTLRLNTKNQIKDWIVIGQNLSYAYLKTKNLVEDDEFGSLVGSAISLDPLTPIIYTDNNNLPSHVQSALAAGQPLVTNNNGNYYGISNYVRGEFGNPQAQIQQARGETIESKILGNIFLDLTPFDGFKFTTRFGIDASFQRFHTYTPTFWFSSERGSNTPTGSDNWNQYYTWLWENFASYEKNIGKHHFSVLGGISYQRYLYNGVSGSYAGLFRELDNWSYADYVTDDGDRIGSNREARALQSVFGRIIYDYDNKYLFNAVFRRDGSSMLADGNKWGTFPSFSAGWVFSNEDFFSPASDIINYAKLRASWGQNGSLSNLFPGQWQNYVSNNTGGVVKYENSDGVYLEGAAPSQLSNPDLKWETSEQVDIGIDLRFFKGDLSFSADYFNKTTKDLITPGAPPLFAGSNLNFVNAGTVVNKGFELELSYENTAFKDLKYNISGNLTTINNEVTYLDPDYPTLRGANIGTGWNGATLVEQGYPIWYFNGYKTNGIFQNQEQINAYITSNKLTGYNPSPGDPIIEDVNNDGQISPADYTYIGDATPDFYFGTRLTMNYKGFDLLFFLQGQVGNEIIMGFNRTDRTTSNKPAFFFDDRWTGDGSTNEWFAANTSSDLVYSSDLMVFDGSYAKVRQLQLGYTLPNSLTEKIKIRNARLYISLDNYFTFTKYPGLDPEAGSNNNNSLGIDRGVYPVPRTVLTGITLDF